MKPNRAKAALPLGRPVIASHWRSTCAGHPVLAKEVASRVSVSVRGVVG